MKNMFQVPYVLEAPLVVLVPLLLTLNYIDNIIIY